MNPLDLTTAFLTALTGSPDGICDFRVINDRVKGDMGKNLRGTLQQLLPTLQQYNQAGWGVFICINNMDGNGYHLNNVHSIRAHVADLDDKMLAQAAYNRAVGSPMPPHIAVQTSPGKFHLYWLMQPYTGNDFYTLQQRKLAQAFDGDKSIIDATRILRVPGFYHCKGEPQLVTCWGIHGGERYTAQQIEYFLQHVNVADKTSARHELGDPKLAAPSIDLLIKALYLMNPNELSYHEWMAASAAFKQAGWTLAEEQQLYDIWSQWCSGYHGANGNDPAENQKIWRSFRDTQVGWGRFQRVTNINAYAAFPDRPVPSYQELAAAVPPVPASVSGGSAPHEGEAWPEMLDATLKAKFFANCFFVEKAGEIFTPSGRFMNSTQFNGAYGGYQFTIGNSGGKLSDEPWKVALRATDWSIPKVDHVRFLPLEEPFKVVTDRRGRKGVNTYIPVKYDMQPGDVSLFLYHVSLLIPDRNDQHIFLSYLAHIIKYPGYKVSWAPMLQSTEGAGKTVFFEVLQHALGEMYVYRPKAAELVASGNKFNAWMRSKLAIVVDEVRVDERRDLIEILKPMISDAQIEVQAKGQDQDMEDNPANWIFFTNFEDALPIHQNGRRFAIFYSAISTKKKKLAAGMDDAYFKRLWTWLREQNGLQAITYYLMNYPIERGSLPVDAPKTTSHEKALLISRTPLEVLIDDKIRAGERGFRNGFVSLTALVKVIQLSSLRNKPAEYTVRKVLEDRGYVELGTTAYPVPGEDSVMPSTIYGIQEGMNVNDYERAQSS